MKSHVFIVVMMLGAGLLSACSFSLASDITPPPNYQSPTPAPTTGPLFPSEPPDVEDGAAIYAEKCAPCHGTTGLGDGPKGKELSVTLPAYGLPDIGRKAIPADYFAVVTAGRIDRFMPPFTGSLNDRKRWNVISYVLSLHTSADEITRGRELYSTNCAQCHGADGSSKFGDTSLTNQAFMAKRSENDFFDAITRGTPNMPGFSQLSDADRWALAAFTRTLTFSAPVPTQAPTATATPLPATATPEATSADTTPTATVEGTAAATSEATTEATSEPTATTSPSGVVSGTVVYAGGALPSDLPIKLQAFEHDPQNPNAAPKQVLDLTGTVNADGSYKFENIEIISGRIFTATVTYAGIDYQAPVVLVSADQTSVTLEPLNIYETTTDMASLQVSQAHVLAQFDGNTLQLLVFYIMTNSGDKTVLITTDGTTLPFIPVPEGATPLGIDPNQGQQGVVVTADGFAMPPSQNQYGVLAAFSLPYKNKAEINFLLKLDIAGGSVLAPENIKVEGDRLTASGTRDMGNGSTFAVYTVPALAAGDTLNISLSGKASTSTTTSTNTGNQGLLIGVGALGLALIGAGTWLYLRDRRKSEEAEDIEEDEEEDDPEEIMDAIIALDDQYRDGNISEEAYQQRRAELKDKLKKRL